MMATLQTQLVDTLAQYDVPDDMTDWEVLENVLGDDLLEVPGYRPRKPSPPPPLPPKRPTGLVPPAP